MTIKKKTSLSLIRVKMLTFASAMGRILAIDVGQKRMGLAVTDPDQIIASPLDTVHVKDIWGYLQKFFASEQVDTVVAGLPLQDSGEYSESYRFVQSFIKKFNVTFPGKKIVLWDERFTSKMAKAAIIDSGINRKRRGDKALYDKVSAAILLQSFMLSKENSGLKKI